MFSESISSKILITFPRHRQVIQEIDSKCRRVIEYAYQKFYLRTFSQMSVVAVVGSRTFSDYEQLETELNKIKIDEIVSGGAAGADTLADIYSRKYGIKMTVFLPDYDRYGRSAPFKRNTQIVESCTEVVAFWDGLSRGTSDTIRKARSMGKPVTIIGIN